MSSATELKQTISQCIQAFAAQPLAASAAALLAALGYRSEKTADLGNTAETLLASIEQFRPELGNINRAKVQASRWKSCAFLFQISNDEIPSLAMGQMPLGADCKLAQGQIESFVFLAIDLQGEKWSRGDLSTITRELNRRFPMPAIVLFRHGALLSLAVIDRRQHLRDASRDVIESRITVIKDVRLANPHRAHIDILCRLALANLGERRRPSNFRELYDDWIAALSTEKLNERFYQQLAWWYLKLTLFHGHLTVWIKGVRNAQNPPAISGGISTTNPGARPCRAHAGRALAGVQRHRADHLQLGGARRTRSRRSTARQGRFEHGRT